MNRTIFGDCRDVMRDLAKQGVRARMCVTSPPYWGGLRDYGRAGQLGLERDPADYVATLVQVFALLRELLTDDGTLWLNVGDVFAASGKGGGGNAGDRASWATVRERKGFRMPPAGYKMKDLTLVAFALADALRRDGWYMRQTIIWRKPAAVEPMRLDRPATSHEYLYLLAKAEHYYARAPEGAKWWGHSVWDVASDSDGQHPAAMPTELAQRCILCGSEPGDLVLDPFMGSGTSARAAASLGRNWIGCELNDDYAVMQAAATAQACFAV
jgi:site-specific DNA-methyltransferase (cytosine-N4-specific)